MKKINRLWTCAPAIFVASIVLVASSNVVSAATAPSLGSESSYAIVSSTFTNSNTSPQTIITGDVCYTTGPTTDPMTITGATSTPCTSVQDTDQTAALGVLNGQTCTSIGAIVDLNAVTIGNGLPGHFPPGCYSSTGAMNITSGTTVTLDGPGVYIFKPNGAVTTGADSHMVLADDACANDVFWAPTGAVTLGADTFTLLPTFVGNIIDAAGITFGHFAVLEGRALSYGGTVTTDANTITAPTCTTLAKATLHVITAVDNTNGGTATPSSFSVHVKSGTTDVSNSPLAGTTTPGSLYSLVVGSYSVSEDSYSPYVQSFSTGCSAGSVTLSANQDETCTITNTYPVITPTSTPTSTPVSTSTSTSTPTPTPVPVYSSGSTSSGGSTHYGCKDPKASNYEYFASSDPALCVYTNDPTSSATTSPVMSAVTVLTIATSSATTTTVAPKLPNTGYSGNDSTLWGIAILASILMLVSASLVMTLRKS